MAIKNKIYVRIHNFDCSLEEITSKLKMNPTGGGLKGDPMPGRKTQILRKQNTWEKRSVLSDDHPVNEHVESLLNELEMKKEAFKELVSKYEGELAFVSYIYDEFNPRINLSKAQ